MDFWADLQETFFLLLGPYITGLLLPVFGGAGVLLAVVMAAARWWKPLPKVAIVSGRDDWDTGERRGL